MPVIRSSAWPNRYGAVPLFVTAEARVVRKGLADGSVRIVIGTHAVAGRQVRFADLGLLVVDEEQLFGAKQKERLPALGNGIHVLTLTATPIPHIMQAAIAGQRHSDATSETICAAPAT